MYGMHKRNTAATRILGLPLLLTNSPRKVLLSRDTMSRCRRKERKTAKTARTRLQNQEALSVQWSRSTPRSCSEVTVTWATIAASEGIRSGKRRQVNWLTVTPVFIKCAVCACRIAAIDFSVPPKTLICIRFVRTGRLDETAAMNAHARPCCCKNDACWDEWLVSTE